ncbi:DUF3502 domain-containing protein [Anaerosporobacter faecicola]|uniref:DUF3502 domain-containing protein n=1 Tax=Anaerosporobacter faecicola TaxID=2718714 RepID=UPI00143AA106|nr:DUF3502 domain-containing protein [Anaerosporobacter faecicola]
MRKRTKKLLSVLLTTAMAVGMLTGCGSNKSNNNKQNSGNSTEVTTEATAEASGDNGETSKVDTSEHVDLTMYLIGDRTQDFDEVYGKINEILEEKLNCTLNVEFLSWGEHDTKYSLLFSSQEDFDLIFTASSWCHYEQTVALGGFAPLSEDFIKTYAPDIWNVVPEMAWEQAKINGEIYMVPNYSNEFGQDVMAVRGDLMKKYGFEDIASWDELMNFYKACAADGMYASNGSPYYQYFQSQGLTTTSGTPQGGELILYNTQNPDDLGFTYILDWDGFREFCVEMKELADAGAWSSDVLNSSDERQTGLLTGRTAGMIWNLGSCNTYAKQANDENADWNVTIVDPVANQPKKVNSYINNGVAINASSKNKERAMMVLNEFYTNPEVYDLAMLGVEGKHWEAVGDDQYKVIDESGYGVSNNCNWGWNNCEIQRKEYIENRTALDDRFDELQEKFNNNIKAEHVYDGFNFDSTNVSTQFAAVEAALGNYYDPLKNGLVDDVDKAIKDMKAALESAGIQDILKELNAQAEAYVAQKQAN